MPCTLEACFIFSRISRVQVFADTSAGLQSCKDGGITLVLLPNEGILRLVAEMMESASWSMAGWNNNTASQTLVEQQTMATVIENPGYSALYMCCSFVGTKWEHLDCSTDSSISRCTTQWLASDAMWIPVSSWQTQGKHCSLCFKWLRDNPVQKNNNNNNYYYNNNNTSLPFLWSFITTNAGILHLFLP